MQRFVSFFASRCWHGSRAGLSISATEGHRQQAEHVPHLRMIENFKPTFASQTPEQFAYSLEPVPGQESQPEAEALVFVQFNGWGVVVPASAAAELNHD